MEKERENLKKDIALVMAGAMGLAQMAGADPASVGVYDGCAWWHCLTWMWFHGAWWHYVVNMMAWLTLMFLWRTIKMADVVWAVGVAAAYGLACRSALPVIGLSGVIYALLGICCLRSRSVAGVVRYNAYVVAGMIVTGVVASVAAEAHVICYVGGAVVAALRFKWIRER